MKTLRQICVVTILSLTLALSVSAGDIHSPGLATTGSTSGSKNKTAPSVSTTVILTIVSLIYR